MKSEELLKEIIRKSHMEIPGTGFEDRVMEKILFAARLKAQRKKNIRLSWIFLLISCFLLATILVLLSGNSASSILHQFNYSPAGTGQILLPAFSLIAAIIILIQADNLFRLTWQYR